MKKLLGILVLTLILVLSGCNENEITCLDNVGNEIECVRIDELNYYTQEEVDELLSKLALGIVFGDFHTLALVDDDFYTKYELDEGFEDVLLYIQELETRIEILEGKKYDN